MVKRNATKPKKSVIAEASQHIYENARTEKGRDLSRLPPEILEMIGEFIQGRKTLQALVATCRSFREIYTPLLYISLMYNLHKLNPVRPRYIELPPGVGHIKNLTVKIDEFGSPQRSGVMYDPRSMNDNYARYLARLIKEMPNLVSFSWHYESYEAEEIVHVLKNKTLLKALKAAPKLQKLCLNFETLLGEEGATVVQSWIPLTGFNNLKSLELYNISGKQVELVKDISAVLARSPTMNTLGLGLACHAEWDILPESMIIPQCDFLEQLCIAYKATSSKPLSLSTLKLGWGMCILESDQPECGNFLEFMFEANELRTLHLYNGLVVLGDSISDEYMPIEWDFLNGCTLLHQVAVNRLDAAVVTFLNHTATVVKEFVLTDRNAMQKGVAQIFFLLLDHSFSYLFVAEDGYHGHREDFDFDSFGSDLSDSETSFMSDSESWDTDDDDADSSQDRETFAALPLKISFEANLKAAHIKDKDATVLDRLKDNGRHLTHLALSIDLENQWDHFCTRLKDLTDLTHIRIMRRTWKSGQWPQMVHSKWSGVHEPKEIALRYACAIKSICPSIKFVQFQEWTWQFLLQSDEAKAIQSDDCSQYRTLEMEWMEVNKIPIFAKDDIETQSGVPIDDMREPLVTDWAHMERIDEIVKERMVEWRRLNPYGDWDDFHLSLDRP